MAYVTTGLIEYLNATGQNNANNIWEATAGSNATLNNYALTSSSGFNGTALVSDGIDDYTSLPNNALFEGTTWTAEIYLSFLALQYWLPILCHNNYTSTNGWEIGLNSATNIYINNGGNENYFDIPITITANTFYHFVMRYNNGTFDVFINGIKRISAPITVTPCNLPVIFAGASRSYSDVNGTADRRRESVQLLRWYNTALLDSDITQNYQDIVNPTTIVTNSLTASIVSSVTLNAILTVTTPVQKLLSSTINSTLSIQSGLGVTKILNSSSNNQISISVNLNVSKQLNSNIASITSVGTSLSIIKPMASNIVISSTSAGNLSIEKSLSINANSNALTTASLYVEKLLKSSVNINSNVGVNLNIIDGISLIASSSSISSISANLNKLVSLNGNVNTISTIQNQLDVAIILGSNIVSKINISGFVDKIINLNGNIEGKTSSILNVAVIPMINLNGDITVISRIQSDLNITKNLSGNILNTVSTQAFMNLAQIIYAELNMTINNNYDLNMNYSINYDFDMKCLDNLNMDMYLTKVSSIDIKL